MAGKGRGFFNPNNEGLTFSKLRLMSNSVWTVTSPEALLTLDPALARPSLAGALELALLLELAGSSREISSKAALSVMVADSAVEFGPSVVWQREVFQGKGKKKSDN